MSEGASLTSFAAEIDVCRDTISEWTKVHEEFSAAVKRAKAKCAAWWEKTNRTLATTGTGNATACVFGLKNMAAEDWRDKIETEQSGTVTNVHKIERSFHKPGDAA
jgi:prophage DNA circulation protein